MRRCHGQGNQRGPQRRGALDFGRAPNPCVPHRGWYAEQLVSLFVDLVPFSGSDLRECDGSLTRSVCNQIFTRPLHWPNAADLPEGATHAIDSGADGIGGIGPLKRAILSGKVLKFGRVWSVQGRRIFETANNETALLYGVF